MEERKRFETMHEGFKGESETNKGENVSIKERGKKDTTEGEKEDAALVRAGENLAPEEANE
jgi:hypothetical protein